MQVQWNVTKFQSIRLPEYFYAPFEMRHKHSTNIMYLLYSVNYASEKVKPEQ